MCQTVNIKATIKRTVANFGLPEGSNVSLGKKNLVILSPPTIFSDNGERTCLFYSTHPSSFLKPYSLWSKPGAYITQTYAFFFIPVLAV